MGCTNIHNQKERRHGEIELMLLFFLRVVSAKGFEASHAKPEKWYLWSPLGNRCVVIKKSDIEYPPINGRL